MIILAISLGNFEIARLLLSSGANPTSKNAAGWSALHEAVSTGDPELVIEILVNRASYRRINELAGRVAFMKHFFSMGKVYEKISKICSYNKTKLIFFDIIHEKMIFTLK